MSSILMTIGFAFVILAGAIHVLIFLLESVLWRSRSTWRGFGVRSAEDAEVIRPWALNQGFYNLFLAAGAIAGGIAGIGSPGVWGSVAIFCALCMVAAALVLIVSSRGKLLRGALVQGAAPLIGLALIGIGVGLR